MKVNPQRLLPAHIPWYQTRFFWGVVFAAYFTGATYIFGLYSLLGEYTYFLTGISYITGMSYPYFLTSTFITESFFFSTSYYALLAAWVYLIFKKEKVVVWSALLLLTYLVIHSLYFYTALQSF